MNYELTIKPYGESQFGDFIIEFNKNEWNSIIEIQKKINTTLEHNFNELSFENLKDFKPLINLNFSTLKNLLNKDLEDYLSFICGNIMENVITIENKEYYIRSELISQKNKRLNPGEKLKLYIKKIYTK